MSSVRVQKTFTIDSRQCLTCGVMYGVDRDWVARRIGEGGDIHCPNGCRRVFRDSRADVLAKKLAAADQREAGLHATLAEEREAAKAIARSLSAIKAAVTRTKRRIGNGVCPCCNRTFRQLAAHIKTKHPEYATEAMP